MTISEIVTGADYDFAIASVNADVVNFLEIPAEQMSQLQASGGVDAVVLLDGDDASIDNDEDRIYFGNTGQDTLMGAGGSDTLAAGQGDDIVYGGIDGDWLFGNLNADRLYGDAGDDTIFGGQDTDILVGDAGNDVLSGDRGDDTLRGGDGDDTLIGGGGSDRFFLEAKEGTDIIADFDLLRDALQLPNGVRFTDIEVQARSDTQTAIVLGSKTLAVLENITASELNGTYFVTAGLFQNNTNVTVTEDALIVNSDGIPNHPTGTFPDNGDSNGDGEPDNPTAILPQNYQFSIPLSPTLAATPTEVGALPVGTPIGVGLNGIPFYGPIAAEGGDVTQAEVFDFANGHPDASGAYHYHQNPILLQQSLGGSSANVIIGYAFDGFPIYGINGENGQPPTDLDRFNGHEAADGEYHYHMTKNFPYILGGYRGVVS